MSMKQEENKMNINMINEKRSSYEIERIQQEESCNSDTILIIFDGGFGDGDECHFRFIYYDSNIVTCESILKEYLLEFSCNKENFKTCYLNSEHKICNLTVEEQVQKLMEHYNNTKSDCEDMCYTTISIDDFIKNEADLCIIVQEVSMRYDASIEKIWCKEKWDPWLCLYDYMIKKSYEQEFFRNSLSEQEQQKSSYREKVNKMIEDLHDNSKQDDYAKFDYYRFKVTNFK